MTGGRRRATGAAACLALRCDLVRRNRPEIPDASGRPVVACDCRSWIPETADPALREAYAATLTEADVKNAIIDNVIRSITVPIEDKIGLLLETVKEKYFIHKRLKL